MKAPRLFSARAFLAGLLFALPVFAFAQGLPVVNVEGSRYSLTLELLALMTVLTLIPSLVLTMTSFVRIIIVMSILRQALGTGGTPPNQVFSWSSTLSYYFYYVAGLGAGL